MLQDIEGSEYEVIEDFMKGFLTAQAQGATPAVLPDQVLFEQHFKTHTDLKWRVAKRVVYSYAAEHALAM